MSVIKKYINFIIIFLFVSANNAYSDNANLYATNTTASVMTPNIGQGGSAFGNLHDCDFNYGVIVD